jgi:hypothetical protein
MSLGQRLEDRVDELLVVEDAIQLLQHRTQTSH